MESLPVNLNPKKIIIFLFCFLPFQQLLATERDSLDLLLEGMTDEELRQTYTDWAARWKFAKPDLSIYICRKGLDWASEREDKPLAAGLLHSMGTAEYIRGEYALALDCYQKSADLYSVTGDALGIANVCISKGQLFRKQKEYESARKEYVRALDIFLKSGDKQSLAMTYNNLGNLYQEWKGDLDNALICYQKSLQYSEEIDDTLSISYSYDFISGIYAQQGRYNEALALLEKALVLRLALNNEFSVAINYNNMGEVYLMQEKYTVSEPYFLKALEISEASDYKDLMVHIYAQLALVSEKKNDFENAYRYLDLRSAVKDSIISERKNQQIAELKEKYESEKKEQEIVSLQKDKEISSQRIASQRNYFISALLILVLGGVIGWLYYNQQQQRNLTRERIEQEKLRTRAMIEAEEKERIRIARELHDGVGQLLAAARINMSILAESEPEDKGLQNAYGLVDDAIREVRSVSHSMMPDALLKYGLVRAIRELIEKISSAAALKINFQEGGWNERWDESSESVLYRVFQELLGNILKHSGATTVNVDLHKFEDEISLIVEDDGKGFDPKNVAENAGIGLRNMRSRVEFLGGNMMVDSTPGRGTTTIISIPLNTMKNPSV